MSDPDTVERKGRVEAEYGYLKGDPVGVLQQIWGELDTALDLEMVPEGVATVLLEGLKLKCELGLARADRAEARNAEDGWFHLAEEDRQMVLTALGDVWRIQPDDEPDPHAATLLFRKLSTTEGDGDG